MVQVPTYQETLVQRPLSMNEKKNQRKQFLMYSTYYCITKVIVQYRLPPHNKNIYRALQSKQSHVTLNHNYNIPRYKYSNIQIFYCFLVQFQNNRNFDFDLHNLKRLFLLIRIITKFYKMCRYMIEKRNITNQTNLLEQKNNLKKSVAVSKIFK